MYSMRTVCVSSSAMVVTADVAPREAEWLEALDAAPFVLTDTWLADGSKVSRLPKVSNSIAIEFWIWLYPSPPPPAPMASTASRWMTNANPSPPPESWKVNSLVNGEVTSWRAVAQTAPTWEGWSGVMRRSFPAVAEEPTSVSPAVEEKST